jgi:3-oxoacyl-[acyl-carrier protein] reductase
MNGIRDFENQIVLITGSSKGIGRETALSFASRGANVVICGRDESRVADTAKAAEQHGKAALGYTGGISTQADAQALVTAVTSRFGRLDVLVNNAGIAFIEPLLECTEPNWQAHIDIHMTATLFCAQAAASVMTAQNYGRIINLSTIAANMANPGFAAYASVKAAVESLTRVMAVELAPHGITVNCVAPGPVRNEQILILYGEERVRERALSIPLERLAEPEDVAHAIRFFALKESGYITGQVLGIDGGARAAGCFTSEIYRKRKSEQAG